MSELLQAIILGIVQGLTEFLPISSTAHLALVPWLLGWDNRLLHSLTFDVALHMGTLMAVLLYFWRDWLKLAGGFMRSVWRRDAANDLWQRLAWLVIAGTIPAAVIGFLFESAVETTLRSPFVVGTTLILFAILLAVAERAGRKERAFERLRLPDAVLIGFAQAIALVPGVSRSGSTITAGLLMGLRRETAARFSFLLSTPIVFGAGVKKALDLREAAITSNEVTLMVVGAIVAGVSGFLCIAWLLAYLQRATLYVFVWYRVILGVIVLVLAATQTLPA